MEKIKLDVYIDGVLDHTEEATVIDSPEDLQKLFDSLDEFDNAE